jgi:hypothetical protein
VRIGGGKLSCEDDEEVGGLGENDTDLVVDDRATKCRCQKSADVRFWHKADIGAVLSDVRFWG